MKLLEFPHSHFCEKARWALDYKGLPFEPIALLPGFHVKTVRKYAPKTSVPVLLHGAVVVQGSRAIIDYLDNNYPEFPLTPTDAAMRQASLDIEQDMDLRLGKNIRRILYYWLLDHPGFLCHCFAHPLPFYKQLVFRMTYPYLRRIIHRVYVVSPEKVEQARQEFDAALTELAETISEAPYLIGERFSSADMAVASMLSLLVIPPEHPLPWREIPDERARKFIDDYRDHPVSHWVRTLYKEYRKPLMAS